jgi:hypothetical protein
MFKASATSESLPATTPTALIAAVRSSDMPVFSGTVVTQLSLGLPELPDLAQTSSGATFASMLSGSHTLMVWYGGVDKQRVALLGTTDETDFFRDGTDMWQWSSDDHTAIHLMVPARGTSVDGTDGTAASAGSGTAFAAMTPAAMAHRALAALDPSTEVSVISGGTIADRSTYELVLTPRSPLTKIGSVHICVDGATKIPLAVRVFARSASTPAIDIAFSSISFSKPSERNFLFTPPSFATVHEMKVADLAGRATSDAAANSAPAMRLPGAVVPAAAPVISGSDWSSVVELRPGASVFDQLARNSLYDQLPAVSGRWGRGRLLDAALVSVLVTDDGRVFIGAVAPAQLYATASAK